MRPPKLDLPLSDGDRFRLRLGYLLLALLWIQPILTWSSLPDQVPIRFGWDGEPVSFAHPGTVWILPVLGVLLFLMLEGLARVPHIHNYGKRLTADNAERLYRNSSRLLREVNIVDTLVFNIVVYSVVTPAFTLPAWPFLIFLVGAYGVPIWKGVREMRRDNFK
jgi:uncharacterized membrane protein